MPELMALQLALLVASALSALGLGLIVALACIQRARPIAPRAARKRTRKRTEDPSGRHPLTEWRL